MRNHGVHSRIRASRRCDCIVRTLTGCWTEPMLTSHNTSSHARCTIWQFELLTHFCVESLIDRQVDHHHRPVLDYTRIPITGNDDLGFTPSITSSTHSLFETGLNRTWVQRLCKRISTSPVPSSHTVSTTNVPTEFSKLHHTQITEKASATQCLPSSSCRTRCIRFSKLIKECTL